MRRSASRSRPREPRPIAGDVPRVHEHEARDGNRSAAGEHADLIGVGLGVEVAAHDGRERSPRRLTHELGQRPDLRLTDVALVVPPVEVRRVEIEPPPGTVHLDSERDPELVGRRRGRERARVARRDRPARQDRVAERRLSGVEAGREHVLVAERVRQRLGLTRPVVDIPDLLQRDHVGVDAAQVLGDGGLALRPRAETPPHVPSGHAQPRVDEIRRSDVHRRACLARCVSERRRASLRYAPGSGVVG